MGKKFLSTKPDNSKSSRLRITLKLEKKNGAILTYRSSRTRRIFSILKHENFLTGYLKVTYPSGFYNDGLYTTKDSLIRALKAFSDKSLIDYFAEEVS